jgi:hypothetical protein
MDPLDYSHAINIGSFNFFPDSDNVMYAGLCGAWREIEVN